jgi:hypothetical protein
MNGLLQKGNRVALYEFATKIDEVEVVDSSSREVKVKSLEFRPGKITEFVLDGHSEGTPTWRPLSVGLGGERIFNQLSPTYIFDEIA